MANSIKQVTNVNGGKANLGDIEKAAIRGVEQGANVFSADQTILPANILYGGAHTVLSEAGTAHTNSTDETALATATFAANTLRAGNSIQVFGQGIATATNASDTLTIKLNFGGAAILTTAALDVADDDIFIVDAFITLRTVGSSGTYVAAGHSYMDANGGTRLSGIKGSTAVDTTAAVTCTLSADWSAANAGNSCRADIFTVIVH